MLVLEPRNWPRSVATAAVLAAAFAVGVGAAVAQQPDEEIPRAPSRFAAIALDADRDSPADYVRDILVLVGLGEPELAKPLFDELNSQALTDEQRVELVQQVGVAKLHRLARTAELGPEAVTFVTECVEAAGRAASDPARLAQLVELAASDSAADRRRGLAGLQGAGEEGVVACVSAMAEADDPTTQNRLREAVVRMAPLANPIVAAALDSPNNAVRQQAAWALGQLRDAPSLPRLAAIAAGEHHDDDLGKAARWALEEIVGVPFQATSAGPLLRSALLNAVEGAPTRRVDDLGQIDVWGWDAQGNRPVRATLTARQASELHAARLASDLWRLDQGDEHAAVLALAYRLQGEWLLAGGDADAELAGPRLEDSPGAMLSGSLALALEEHLTGAAVSLCGALGERRSPDALRGAAGQPAPLAAALTHPHAAVRFAALAAIMSIDPQHAFAGSSGVADALLHFASSDGARKAVVAMPRLGDAANVGGQLATIGFEPLVTNLGDQASTLAAQSPDVELVLLDMSILRPGVREVLFRIRRQAATADLPVALLAADGQLDRAQQLAREHERVTAFPRPHSAESASSLAEAALASTPRGAPSAADRAAQAAQAAKWIERLLAGGPSFYNLRGRSAELLAAINNAAAVEASIPALALLGTPDSQRTLANLASGTALPLADRDAAAQAFARSVDRHGLLLTTEQILNQYDRYNASEQSDADTQRVLGELLDAIESLREESLRDRTLPVSGP